MNEFDLDEDRMVDIGDDEVIGYDDLLDFDMANLMANGDFYGY